MKKFLISVFLTLFASAAAAYSQDSYKRQHLWDKDIDAFLEIDKKQTPPEKPYLFVGSSSVRMWRTLRKDLPNIKVINRAFGGSEFEDLIFYADKIVFPYKPKAIFVYEGDNDINSGKTAERVVSDFKKFVALVKTHLPKTHVFFISIKPSIAREKLLPEMQKANALIKAETKTLKNVDYVDIATPMLDKNGKPRTDIFIEDDLHMNAKGYEIWARVIKKCVD